jgi:hypothetical protein
LDRSIVTELPRQESYSKNITSKEITQMAISANIAGPRSLELQKLADYGSKQGFPITGPGLGKNLTAIKQDLKTQGKPFPEAADSYTPSGKRSDGIEIDLNMFETARKLFGK